MMHNYVRMMRAARRAKRDRAGEKATVFYERDDEPLTKARRRVSTNGAQSKGTSSGDRKRRVTTKGRSMAAKKKGGKRKGGRKKARTPAQIAATKKLVAFNKRKARAAGKTKTKSPRKAAHTASKKRKKGKGRRRSRKVTRLIVPGRARTTTVRTSRTRNNTSIAILPVPTHRPKPRKGRRKSTAMVKAKENPIHHRRGRGRRRRARESYMMQNPLSGAELFVGAVTSLVGVVAWDIMDRVLATHPLTTGTTDSAGNTTYSDTPPTTGSYPNLYNGTAVLAPFSAVRWVNGLAFVIVPFGLGHFVKNPMGRSALQCFGFGSLVGFGLKVAQQLVARLTIKTSFGQRVYDDQMRAMVLKQMGGSSGTGTATFPLASLPTTGLGGHAGVGSCCSSCAQGRACSCGRTAVAVVQQPMGGPPPPPPQQPQPPSPPSPPSDGGNPVSNTPNPSVFQPAAPAQGIQGVGAAIRFAGPSRQQLANIQAAVNYGH